MRDYAVELKKRVEYVKNKLKESGASGIVYGNSGGKDCALVGIICKKACENTLAVIMPCNSKVNLTIDMQDAIALCNQFDIEYRTVDLTATKAALVKELGKAIDINRSADININPRLRMTTLYAIGAAENRLVAGTGNKSEIYMGYFTKWGDGAYDFDPIADLTVGEVYEFLAFLDAPASIRTKAPSAGLFEGQTDELEMGVTYKTIDDYINGKNISAHDKEIIDGYHRKSEHKRVLSSVYKEITNGKRKDEQH